MQSIQVRRYEDPEAVGYQGYVQPDDLSWILFVSTDGRVTIFDERDEDGGVVVPSPDEALQA